MSCRRDIPCLFAPWQVLQRAKACDTPRVRCKTPRVQARYPLPFRAVSRRVLTGVHGAVFLCFRRSSKSRMCLYRECVFITDLGLCHDPIREAAVEHFGAGVSADRVFWSGCLRGSSIRSARGQGVPGTRVRERSGLASWMRLQHLRTWSNRDEGESSVGPHVYGVFAGAAEVRSFTELACMLLDIALYFCHNRCADAAALPSLQFI